MRTATDVRLFFALWPDDDVRYQLAENLKRFNIDSDKSRPVNNSNLHMTLHFIGNTTMAEMKCLHQQAGQVNAVPFDLILDSAGFFRKPKVFWFGCQNTPGALIDLHQNLGEEISECEYTPESRSFSPHITVARKIYRAPEPIAVEPVHWHVNRFVMVESVSVFGGVRYEVVESYYF
jgi:2'-5' RNA ligase